MSDEHDFDGWELGRPAWCCDDRCRVHELRFVETARHYYANGGIFASETRIAIDRDPSFRHWLQPEDVHETRQAAIAVSIDRARGRVEAAQAGLDRAQAEFDEACRAGGHHALEPFGKSTVRSVRATVGLSWISSVPPISDD